MGREYILHLKGGNSGENAGYGAGRPHRVVPWSDGIKGPSRKITEHQQAEEQGARIGNDFVPMHRKLGDETELLVGSENFSCHVVGIGSHGALHKDIFFDKYFQEDYRTGKITLLDDGQRCTICGEFVCQCNQENERTTETMNMTPWTFAEIEKADEKDKIKCVEGKITWLGAVFSGTYKSGPNEGQEYSGRFGSLKLKEGKEIKINFSCAEVLPEDSLKGKNVRIFCNEGDKGLSGVQRDEDDVYKGKTTPKIKLTPTAHIEILGAGGEPASAKKDSAKSQTKTSSSDSPSGASYGGEPPKTAVLKYLQLMAIVRAGLDYMGDKIPPVSDVALQAITATIAINLVRGDRLPDSLRKLNQSTETLEGYDMTGKPDQPWGDEEGGKTNATNWREFVHPKRQKTLDEVSKEDPEAMLRFYVYHLITEPSAEGAQEFNRFKINMLAWAAENDMSPKEALVSMFHSSEEIKDNKQADIQDLFNHFGGEGEITDEVAIEALTEFDGLLEAVIREAEAKKTKKKKPIAAD